MEAKVIKITILRSKQNEMLKSFEAVKRACKKFDMSEPSIDFSDVYSKEIVVQDAQHSESGLEISEFFDVMDVTINVASMFKLNGDYQIFGIINHDTGNSFTVNIEDEIPSQYSDVTNTHCEHCNQKRARNKSFILKDSQKQFIKVGKSCMKQFVGLNPESFVSALSILNEFKVEIESYTPKREKGIGNIMNTAHSMDLVITLASKLITSEGYVKKLYDNEEDRFGFTKHRPERINQGEATGDKLIEQLLNKDIFLNTKTDTNLVAKVRHYFENLEETREVTYRDAENNNEKVTTEVDSVFNIKLKEFTGRTKIRLHEAMSVAAGVNAYYLHLEREAKLAKDKESNWVGEIGTKMILRLILEGLLTGDGRYGIWTLWTLRDEKGNIFKKFGQLSAEFLVEKCDSGDSVSYYTEFNIGDIFEFTADIKEHSTYKEVKNTTLGRLSKVKSKSKKAH